MTSLAECAVDLPPDAKSASAARAAIRELVRRCGRSEWLDAAELAVTELVTNAVLHAHTQIHLSASCAHELRVEVTDQSPAWPTQREYGQHATTGRGMGLVAAVTQSHGVTRLADGGKSVWFVINSTAATAEPEDLGSWDDVIDDLLLPTTEQPAVRLVRLPSTLWLAAIQQHDAVLRELALRRSARGEPVDDLVSADAARVTLQSAVAHALDAARAAGRARSPLPVNHPARLEEVPDTIDVDLSLSPADAVSFALLQDVLDEAERLAASGQMLCRAGLPEVIAVRDWACEQVIAQLNGQGSSPWPGTDAERFTQLHDAEAGWTIDWDTRAINEAAVGAVAADDSNRIIAISRPLADALGWAPVDLIGRRVVAIVPPQFREAHVAGFTRHLTTGEAHALGVDLELPVLRADSTEVLCDFFIEAHRTPSGRSVYVSWVTPKPESI